MKVTLGIPVSDIADSIAFGSGNSELAALILRIDHQVGEVSFTEKVMKALAASIRQDMDDEEFSTLIAELAEAR